MEEYSVEFMLSGNDIALDKLTKTLNEAGHQLTVTKDGEKSYRVHILAADPKKVFDRTSRFGKLTYIKVDEHPCDQK